MAKQNPKANRRTSITDLARTLGMSISTVSRALAGHAEVSEATKQRVRQLAEELHYQPNQLAAALRRGRSNTLGVLVPHITGHFFPEVVNGIAVEASKAGYNVMICQSNEDVEQEKKNLELLMNAQVEGILVSHANTTLDFAHFDAVNKLDIPLVFFDRVVEGMQGHHVGSVVLDDYAGAYAVVSHLIEQGCRRIAHFSGPLHVNINRNRHQGYLDALTDHHVPVIEDLTCFFDLNLETGAVAMRELLQSAELPDAVFASNDLAAAGAMQVLKERGLRVPQDIAVAGFSNETFTILTEPTLTTVDQCCHEMGQTAVQQLVRMIPDDSDKTPDPIVLKPRLIVRNSSRRLPDEAQ
ncbi:LacI family transcriptional regulator [Hymenobacter busanensis]|uniref:LacI family transcriptional regulator n=1 Tax=Hymenobacter busanensis TaxID=2607656 RepID=A0A7L5A4L6_9BACT|nr:LacI family DNA-binding transcriptional regulator [Hymenobacter busanensis]KAA9338453.1 LacI family transcriptional regulator [Hymenobacter busanensis]QHJ09120.1 substrate-binding domain-containing protein [Hymenobacter busanensis]